MKCREARTWRIQLIGRVAVQGPDGAEIRLPTRKVAGVVCVLVVAQGRPVARRQLEEILWPDSAPEKRTQSLRNALTALRRLLGDQGPIEVTRTSCRLRPDSTEMDYPPKTQHDQIALAPELEGRWFVRLREGRLSLSDLGSSLAAAPESVEDSFARVLHWMADCDPARALELMVAAPELSASLKGDDLHDLGNRINARLMTSHPRYGWLLHFRGVSSYLRGDVRPGMTSLTAAVRFAMEQEDSRLLGETVRWLSAPCIVTGDAAGALSIVERSLAFAESRKDVDAVSLLAHAQGVAFHHLGRYSEGESAMLRALEGKYYGLDLAARAQLLGNIAIFRAAHGHRAGAAQAAAEASDLIESHPNWRVSAAGRLASGMSQLRAKELDGAEQDFVGIMRRRRSGERDFTAIDVYAREASAMVWLLRGEREQASRRLANAVHMRRIAGMGLTQWDQRRLAPLAKSL